MSASNSESTAEPVGQTAHPRPVRRPRTMKARTYLVLRWLHIYTSMISLLIVLFFSVTGVFLNHPDWTLGVSEARHTLKGTLPQNWKAGGAVDWLRVTAYLKSQPGLHGIAGDFRTDALGDTLTLRAPGYSADLTIDPKTGTYTATTDAQGWVAGLNDLHRGRDAGPAWSVALDLAGYFLTLIALTGLGLLLYLKKIRVAALITLLGGSLIVLALMRFAL
jgi:hypothetical protein